MDYFELLFLTFSCLIQNSYSTYDSKYYQRNSLNYRRQQINQNDDWNFNYNPYEKDYRNYDQQVKEEPIDIYYQKYQPVIQWTYTQLPPQPQQPYFIQQHTSTPWLSSGQKQDTIIETNPFFYEKKTYTMPENHPVQTFDEGSWEPIEVNKEEEVNKEPNINYDDLSSESSSELEVESILVDNDGLGGKSVWYLDLTEKESPRSTKPIVKKMTTTRKPMLFKLKLSEETTAIPNEKEKLKENPANNFYSPSTSTTIKKPTTTTRASKKNKVETKTKKTTTTTQAPRKYIVNSKTTTEKSKTTIPPQKPKSEITFKNENEEDEEVGVVDWKANFRQSKEEVKNEGYSKNGLWSTILDDHSKKKEEKILNSNEESFDETRVLNVDDENENEKYIETENKYKFTTKLTPTPTTTTSTTTTSTTTIPITTTTTPTTTSTTTTSTTTTPIITTSTTAALTTSTSTTAAPTTPTTTTTSTTTKLNEFPLNKDFIDEGTFPIKKIQLTTPKMEETTTTQRPGYFILTNGNLLPPYYDYYDQEPYKSYKSKYEQSLIDELEELNEDKVTTTTTTTTTITPIMSEITEKVDENKPSFPPNNAEKSNYRGKIKYFSATENTDQLRSDFYENDDETHVEEEQNSTEIVEIKNEETTEQVVKKNLSDSKDSNEEVNNFTETTFNVNTKGRTGKTNFLNPYEVFPSFGKDILSNDVIENQLTINNEINNHLDVLNEIGFGNDQRSAELIELASYEITTHLPTKEDYYETKIEFSQPVEESVSSHDEFSQPIEENASSHDEFYQPIEESVSVQNEFYQPIEENISAQDNKEEHPDIDFENEQTTKARIIINNEETIFQSTSLNSVNIPEVNSDIVTQSSVEKWDEIHDINEPEKYLNFEYNKEQTTTTTPQRSTTPKTYTTPKISTKTSTTLPPTTTTKTKTTTEYKADMEEIVDAFNSQYYLDLIPTIIENLRQGTVTEEEENILSTIFKSIWPVIKEEAEREDNDEEMHPLIKRLLEHPRTGEFDFNRFKSA